MADDFDVSQFKEIFVSESKEHLSVLNANLLELEKNPSARDLLNEVFRAAHTLKGMAATMGFDKVTELTHTMENLLDKLRSGKIEAKAESIDILFDCFDSLESLLDEIVSGQDKGINIQALVQKLKNMDSAAVAAAPQPAVKAEKIVPAENIAGQTAPPPPQKTEPAAPAQVPAKEEPKPSEAAPPQAAEKDVQDKAVSSGEHKSQTVRIKVEHLDKLMNLVGELVIAKAQLSQIAEKEQITELSSVINGISQYTTELQEEVLKTRMVPVKQIFDRYPRMVRDLTHRLSKEIEFVMTGTEIEIDRMLLDQINEPLVHLLRNSVDHGIESPETRKMLNKNISGTVRLNARREKGFVWIEVSDDGKGMDAEEIKRKAVEKGIIDPQDAQQLSESDAFMLICHPGFSLAKEITDISGRGVGMDVVRNLVEAFNGKLEIRSKKGEGSVFVVQLPLTMAIIQALLVNAGKEVYAIPLTNVAEIARIEKEAIKTIDKKEVLLLRNEVIPLVSLGRVFNSPGSSNSELGNYTVIVELASKKVGIVVDGLIGKQEIVIKTLSGILRSVKNFSGATILGDGRVVLILDVVSIYGS
ncbi:MAG: hypothetical protein A2339_07790 [Elusimicrobia bacterium RIFOXYB12_FULL_50_12]|nr:MAG: hypothetical protein A2278_02940 [Elusimicrobia bacterium RIFOXYA12_FULL_49_49]OGS10134.1 MAG: hypothetical protein A2386_02890 [Elusimicrobia bacterium RIFOXYB1_FULL_48_9]OGS16438.1 MAG: hypothetical protein A2251_06395 [Elusimicrobia bacterium RIFOXYA2_FULL_47_53]OGS27187.1 MAG: hypothetical protein A2339_07790 [Elusimicrobia bacterium RIFOXYB12_FULL_50_12]OGS30386.1 MAG: hypothetical protein A2323_02650 [Elusimicrobia bacterium RIFOXYB2_FULL_46_23]